MAPLTLPFYVLSAAAGMNLRGSVVVISFSRKLRTGREGMAAAKEYTKLKFILPLLQCQIPPPLSCQVLLKWKKKLRNGRYVNKKEVGPRTEKSGSSHIRKKRK